MKPLIRLLAFVLLLVTGFGIAQTGVPDLTLHLPEISLPAIDDRPHATFNRGQRVMFDEPSSWHFGAGSVVEVWWCAGSSEIITGPADVDNICAMAMFR